MAKMSNYLENALINATLRNTAYTSPVTVYVALYTTDPTDADSGTEVSGGAYARQAVTFGAPTDGVATNSAGVNFPTATANWGIVTHIGIRDASTAGNLLYHGVLTTARTINTNDQLTFLIGQISVSLA